MDLKELSEKLTTSDIYKLLSFKKDKQLDKLAENLTLFDACTLMSYVRETKSNIPKSKRLGIYPIENWHSFERAKNLLASFWTADEIKFFTDFNDFNSLSEDERKPLIYIFGFFAVGDGTVSEVLLNYLIDCSRSAEERMFYIIQLLNEQIHNETYGNMIHTLLTTKAEREKVFNAVENIQTIKKMNDYIQNIVRNPDGMKQLYVSLAIMEFVMFTPLFCIIFWYKNYKKGKLKEIMISNEMIAKDEGSHCKNGCENYLSLPINERYTDHEIHEMIKYAISICDEFTKEIFEDINLTNLNFENVSIYNRYVADVLLERLGHSDLYKVDNPFEWMEYHKFVPKTNFYEGTVTQYTKFNVTESINNAKMLSNDKYDPEADLNEEQDFEY